VIAIEATMELPNWIDQSVLILLALGLPSTTDDFEQCG
jgi:hypothetical protein